MKSLLLRSAMYSLALTLLISCSPEKRLARLVKKYPQLVSHDTIWNTDTLRIEAKSIGGEIQLDKKYEKLDSLLALYSKDTLINKETITNTIKNYIVNKPILLDTISFDSIGIHFKLFEHKGKLKYTINIDEQELIKKYATSVSSVNPVQYINAPTKWWQWVLYVIAGLSVAFVALDLWSSRRD